MEITARDLSRLIELNKRRAEGEFKKKVFGAADDLAAIESNAKEIESKARAAGVEIAVPNQKKLDELSLRLDSFTPDDIRESLKIKDGKVYAVLHERGLIVKKNFENRLEIAKLSILICRLNAEERKQMLDIVRGGALPESVKLTAEPDSMKKMARFLGRCGFSCVSNDSAIVTSQESSEKEIRLEVSSRYVWITEAARMKLEENQKKMQSLNASIQLKNAERQIKLFSDEEEGKFAGLQKEYLELLKQQDELLREFNEEEKLSVKS